MENEIMDYEEMAMEPEFDEVEVETENSGLSTGVAMLIGAGLTAASVAAVKLGKKLYAKYKAHKEFRSPATEVDFADMSDEEDVDVTE